MTGRVLIVDDTQPNLLLLERQLSDEFFDVLTARSGAQALEIAARERPDIILLDVMMPGMDGFEVCRRLKADRALMHIPVVMVTALDQPAARVQALDAGADDFLIKPVRDIELFARVRSLIRLKLLFDELHARELTDDMIGLNADDALGDATPIVAVVDDGSLPIAEVITHLQRQVSIVTLAPEQARNRLEKMPCDLVILGLESGRVDGFRLVAQLRSHRDLRSVPVLAVIDREDPQPLVRGFELGISDCLKYPTDSFEITTRVRALLRRKRLSDRLRANVHLSMRLAMTDAVTGVYNRHYMTNHLDTLVKRARAEARQLSLLMIDIDHFKRMNDLHGHAVGDAVLRAVAQRIACNIRGVDMCARYGGEEFVVTMPDTDATHAREVAERIRAVIAETGFDVAGQPSEPLTVSIGVAGYDGRTAERDDYNIILARADAALYEAKRGGRNRIIVDDQRVAA